MMNRLRKQYREIIGYRTTHHQDLTGQDLSKGYTFKVTAIGDKAFKTIRRQLL